MSAVLAQPIPRNQGLGASDAAAAVGLSKWQTPYELWLEKTGQSKSDFDAEALPIAMGNALEPVVLAHFTKRTGLSVSRRQEQVVDPSWPTRWVTLDGVASDGVPIEAKSAGFADPAEWGDEYEDDAVPMQYYLQAQHNMACTAADLVYMPLIVLNRQFRLYRVRRNDEVIAKLTDGERLFWQCVEARVAPDPVSIDDVKLRWPSDSAGELMASTDIAAAVAELQDKRMRAKGIEADIDALELKVKAFMGEHGVLIPPGGGKTLITWKQAKPSRVLNADKLRAAHPAIYSQFEFERPGSRRFLVK
ncbi:MAG: endonuclease [Pseudomonadota bacterium]|jgi:putative phage-type endonuclease